MTIALDHDGCFTLDPELWKAFTTMAEQRGHRVICVTGRKPSQPPEGRTSVVYAPNGYKADAAKEAGERVDVWIDDLPGMIQRSLILEF